MTNLTNQRRMKPNSKSKQNPEKEDLCCRTPEKLKKCGHYVPVEIY